MNLTPDQRRTVERVALSFAQDAYRARIGQRDHSATALRRRALATATNPAASDEKRRPDQP